MDELIIFAKYPKPGRVKSRLAKDFGNEKATEIYKRMAERVINDTKPHNNEYKVVLYYDPPESKKLFQAWLGNFELRVQCGNDLGEKIHNAFAESLRYAARSVVIGTDCVDINHKLIVNAFKCLNRSDIVLGPAKDGGYYLVGLKKVYPELFKNIEWSTETVLSKTVKISKKLNLNISILEELMDIDTIEQYYEKFGK